MAIAPPPQPGEHPTEAFFAVQEINRIDQRAHLESGVFSDEQLRRFTDPQADQLALLDAAGKAVKDSADFRDFAETHAKVDPDEPFGDMRKLLKAGIEYAQNQKTIKDKIEDPDVLEYLTSQQVSWFNAAGVEEKAWLVGQAVETLLYAKGEIAALKATPGLTEWMSQEDPRSAGALVGLPVREQHDLLREKNAQFKTHQAEIKRLEEERAAAEAQAKAERAAAKEAAEIKKALEFKQEKDAADRLLDLFDDKGRFNSYLLKNGTNVEKMIEDGVPTTAILAVLEETHQSHGFVKYLRKLEKQQKTVERAANLGPTVDKPVAVKNPGDLPPLRTTVIPRIDVIAKRSNNRSRGVVIQISGQKAGVTALEVAEATRAHTQTVRDKLTEIAQQAGEDLSRLSPEARQKLSLVLAAGTIAVTTAGGLPSVTNHSPNHGSKTPIVQTASEEKTPQTPADMIQTAKAAAAQTGGAVAQPQAAANVTGGAKFGEKTIGSVKDIEAAYPGLNTNEPVTKRTRDQIIKQAQEYAQAKAAAVSAEAEAAEPSLARTPHGAETVQRVDKVALYAIHNRTHGKLTNRDVKRLGDEAAMVMAAARHPRTAQNVAPKLKPHGRFQKEIVQDTRETILADATGYTHRQKLMIATMIARTFESATPTDHIQRYQVRGAFRARAADITWGNNSHTAEAYEHGGTHAVAANMADKSPHSHERHRAVQVTKFIRALAHQESGGNPDQPGSAGDARGKYQYIDPTWRASAAEYYPHALKYAKANEAPEAIQDAVAFREYEAKFKQLNGDLFKLAVSHFYPAANENPALLDVVPQHNVITPRQYAERLLHGIKTGTWHAVQLKLHEAPGLQHIHDLVIGQAAIHAAQQKMQEEAAAKEQAAAATQQAQAAIAPVAPAAAPTDPPAATAPESTAPAPPVVPAPPAAEADPTAAPVAPSTPADSELQAPAATNPDANAAPTDPPAATAPESTAPAPPPVPDAAVALAETIQNGVQSIKEGLQSQVEQAKAAAEAAVANKEAAATKVVDAVEQEYADHGNKPLETDGPNAGPVVEKYTGGIPGVKWCAYFASWAVRQGNPDFGSIGSVADLATWFQQHGTYFAASSTDNTPRKGDVIMYGTEHTGIVVRVDGDWVETIEGNTSGDGSYNADGGTVGHKGFNYKTAGNNIAFGRP